jgi:hypothetical protein
MFVGYPIRIHIRPPPALRAPIGTHQRHQRGQRYQPRVRYSEAVFVETTLAGPGPPKRRSSGRTCIGARRSNGWRGCARPRPCLPGPLRFEVPRFRLRPPSAARSSADWGLPLIRSNLAGSAELVGTHRSGVLIKKFAARLGPQTFATLDQPNSPRPSGGLQ